MDKVSVTTHPHPLEPYLDQSVVWHCSDRSPECTRDIAGPTIRWTCRECQYDLCRTCVEHWRAYRQPTVNEQRQLCWVYNVQKTCSQKMLESMSRGELEEFLKQRQGKRKLSLPRYGRFAKPVPSSWCTAPSVGTWLSMRPVSLSSSSTSIAPSWSTRPSVGTWLRKPPTRSANVVRATATKLCMEVFRSHVWQVLVDASSEDDVQKLVDEVSDNSPDDGTLDIRALRIAARSICAQAGQNGRLHEVLSQLLQEYNIDVRSADAQEILVNALHDGTLDEALLEVQQEDELDDEQPADTVRDMDSLRSFASQVLLRTLNDGSLQQRLSEMCQEKSPHDAHDIDSLRAHAYKSLLHAFEDGRLHEALSATYRGKSSEDLELLRCRLRDVLRKSFHDGTLKQVLAQVIHNAQGGGREDRDVQMLRSWAQEVLRNSADDGTLMEALSAVCEGRSTVDRAETCAGQEESGNLVFQRGKQIKGEYCIISVWECSSCIKFSAYEPESSDTFELVYSYPEFSALFRYHPDLGDPAKKERRYDWVLDRLDFTLDSSGSPECLVLSMPAPGNVHDTDQIKARSRGDTQGADQEECGTIVLQRGKKLDDDYCIISVSESTTHVKFSAYDPESSETIELAYTHQEVDALFKSQPNLADPANKEGRYDWVVDRLGIARDSDGIAQRLVLSDAISVTDEASN